MSDQPPQQENVAGSVICRSCGYDLRGLPVDGRCPECEARIDVSVKADRLDRVSSPAARRRPLVIFLVLLLVFVVLVIQVLIVILQPWH